MMNENEVTLVDELVALGLTRDWLVAAIETPNLSTIERTMTEFKEKVNDPFYEVSLLDALFERLEQYPTQQSFLIVELLLTYNSYNNCHYLNWLAKANYEQALPILDRLIAANHPFVDEIHAVMASHTIARVYNGDLNAAMQDASSLVASTAAARIIDKLEAAQDVVGLCRALTFPFTAIREYVAWHLGRQNLHEAVEPLIAALRVETNEEAMRAMMWALGVLRSAQAIDTVRTFLNHESRLVTATAREALTKLHRLER